MNCCIIAKLNNNSIHFRTIEKRSGPLQSVSGHAAGSACLMVSSPGPQIPKPYKKSGPRLHVPTIFTFIFFSFPPNIKIKIKKPRLSLSSFQTQLFIFPVLHSSPHLRRFICLSLSAQPVRENTRIALWKELKKGEISYRQINKHLAFNAYKTLSKTKKKKKKEKKALTFLSFPFTLSSIFPRK